MRQPDGLFLPQQTIAASIVAPRAASWVCLWLIDHIVPRSLGGGEEPENLAASCYRCNEFKWAKTHDLDPATGQLASLFHPRREKWSEHFQWVNGGTHIAGLTPTGRATVVALRLNNEFVVEARALWIAREWHPPMD